MKIYYTHFNDRVLFSLYIYIYSWDNLTVTSFLRAQYSPTRIRDMIRPFFLSPSRHSLPISRYIQDIIYTFPRAGTGDFHSLQRNGNNL